MILSQGQFLIGTRVLDRSFGTRWFSSYDKCRELVVGPGRQDYLDWSSRSLDPEKPVGLYQIWQGKLAHGRRHYYVVVNENAEVAVVSKPFRGIRQAMKVWLAIANGAQYELADNLVSVYREGFAEDCQVVLVGWVRWLTGEELKEHKIEAYSPTYHAMAHYYF